MAIQDYSTHGVASQRTRVAILPRIAPREDGQMVSEWSDPDAALPSVMWDSLLELASAYWAERPGEPGGVYGPAQQTVSNLIDSGSSDCVDLLSALAATSPDDEAIVFVGAGPVEDLMSHSGQGERFIDELERKAADDQRLATAIKSVWLGERVTDEVRQRLVAMGATNVRRER
jgi:hypothetical protein